MKCDDNRVDYVEMWETLTFREKLKKSIAQRISKEIL